MPAAFSKFGNMENSLSTLSNVEDVFRPRMPDLCQGWHLTWFFAWPTWQFSKFSNHFERTLLAYNKSHDRNMLLNANKGFPQAPQSCIFLILWKKVELIHQIFVSQSCLYLQPSWTLFPVSVLFTSWTNETNIPNEDQNYKITF